MFQMSIFEKPLPINLSTFITIKKKKSWNMILFERNYKYFLWSIIVKKNSQVFSTVNNCQKKKKTYK